MIKQSPSQYLQEIGWLRRFTFSVVCLIFFCICIGIQSVTAAELNHTFQLGSGNEDIQQLLRVKEMLPGDGVGFKQRFLMLAGQGRIDLSRRDLRGAEIHLQDSDLKDISFARSNLTDANLEETRFEGCSFRGARLCRAVFTQGYLGTDCDLEDADISGCKLAITRKQLESTANYKNRDLSNMGLFGEFDGCDFANFDLSNTSFGFWIPGCSLKGCNFTNARISGCELPIITQEQLVSTKSFKERNLHGVAFFKCDFTGVDFSGFDLGKFTDCDLTDAKFKDAYFAGIGSNDYRIFYFGFERCVLSAEQFYSTRNYRSNKFRAPPDRIGLAGMNLDNWRFDNLELRGFQIHGCSLNGSTFENARGGSFRASDLSIEQLKTMWNYKNNALNENGFYISDELRQKLK